MVQKPNKGIKEYELIKMNNIEIAREFIKDIQEDILFSGTSNIQPDDVREIFTRLGRVADLLDKGNEAIQQYPQSTADAVASPLIGGRQGETNSPSGQSENEKEQESAILESIEDMVADELDAMPNVTYIRNSKQWEEYCKTDTEKNDMTEFREYLENKGMKENTIRTYIKAIKNENSKNYKTAIKNYNKFKEGK